MSPPANIYQLPHKMGPLTSIHIRLVPPQTSIRAQEPEKKQTIAMLRNHQKPSTKHKFSKSHFLKTSFASTCPVKDICLSVEMSFSPLVCFSTFKFVGLVVAEYSPFLNKSHFLLKLFQSFPSPIFRHIINSHCASRQSPQYLNI